MTVSLNTVTSNAAYQPYVPTAAPARDGGCRVVVAGGDVVGAVGRGGVAGRLHRGDGVFACRSAQYFAAGGPVEKRCYAEEGSNVDTSTTAQQAQDQNIVSSLAESATSSGCYTGTGASARTVRAGRRQLGGTAENQSQSGQYGHLQFLRHGLVSLLVVTVTRQH
jgi:hypothetical protein